MKNNQHQLTENYTRLFGIRLNEGHEKQIKYKYEEQLDTFLIKFCREFVDEYAQALDGESYENLDSAIHTLEYMLEEYTSIHVKEIQKTI